MDLMTAVISALSGAAIGFAASLLWRWSRKPKPVDRHEVPRLRAEIMEVIKEQHKNDSNDFGLMVDSASVKDEGVEYLRLFAKFCKDYPLSDIRRSAVLLKKATMDQDGKTRGHGYTDYGTNVELSPWHIEMMQAFTETENSYQPQPTTRDEKFEIWSKVSEITAYAYRLPHDADKILSIVRDRGIYELETVQALLKDMETPGTGAISSGAL